MRKVFMVSMVVAFALLMVACGTADNSEQTSASNGTDVDEAEDVAEEVQEEELTIQHELGETTVKKNPEKVVVFDFGVLDTLDALGIEVIALPKMNVPEYLSKYEADTYENVGSLKEPDFEKINALQPDLIIISSRQMDLYDEFSEIAPTIYLAVDTANYVESFKENVKTLGDIFDKADAVEEELAKIDEAIANLNEKAAASGQSALVVLANDGKVSAYGPASRFGLIHDEFGFTPVDENIEVSTHGQSISFEYIVEKDPDILFVIDRGAAVGGESSAKQVVENELVQTTSAYKNDNIVYLDPDYWYLSGGGLVSVAEMVAEVEQILE